MAYFLGRDVDVFITLETQETDKAIGLSAQLDSQGYPLCAVVASGTTAPSGTIFANTMNSNPGNVSGSRVHDLTGVDLSISASDEEVGPFLGHAATQSVELRKEQVVTLTHKKTDECWDAVFNGPSDILTFDGSYLNTNTYSGVSGESTITGNATDVAECSVGDYIGGDDAVPLGTQIIQIPTTTTMRLSNSLTDTLSAAAGELAVNPLPTYRRQGARAGIMYSGSTMQVSSGRRPLWKAISGSSYGAGNEKVYYGYRVHIKMKDGGEVYTVKNAAITGHTVSMNADGTSEETMELKAGIPATMYTGASDTFYATLSQIGEF